MEYKVLGLSENASLEEMKKALHKIREQSRPDILISLPEIERKKNKHYLQLAEESFQIICQKRKVNDALSSLSFMQNPGERNVSLQISSYSYENLNGNVSESGTINGRPMTNIELERHR